MFFRKKDKKKRKLKVQEALVSAMKRIQSEELTQKVSTPSGASYETDWEATVKVIRAVAGVALAMIGESIGENNGRKNN